MNSFNPFYRKRRKSSTHELVDTADTVLQKRSCASGWDFPQLPDHENQFGEPSDAKESETDIDVATSQKPTDAVFSYLSAIGPIRVLTREEELGLAKNIAEGCEVGTSILLTTACHVPGINNHCSWWSR